ncbi:MAG: hypothetical protein HFJ10_11640 [Lachnospiraceae bacterium]|jgi:hypothetical protein|nr:hypothetical protein [Lachnospiraceae bacterium]
MKRILRIGAGALLAVLLLIAVKNEYARLLPVSSYGMQAAIQKKSVDHLFIGSSMFRQGLSIDILESELEGTSFILSYNGNQPAFIARELEYMLEEGLEVKNLYLDLYPYTAAATPWLSDTKILLDTDLAFKIDAWNLMASNSETIFLDFYEMFVTANNEQLLTYPIHNRLVSSQFRNGGNLLITSGQTKEYLDSLGMLGKRDGLQEAQVEGYERILELAGSHNIQVYFLETPKYERMYQDEDYMELYAACIQEIRRLAEGKEDTVILSLSKELNFDHSNPGYYQDLIHLSTEGRTTYTRLLCQALKN